MKAEEEFSDKCPFIDESFHTIYIISNVSRI